MSSFDEIFKEILELNGLGEYFRYSETFGKLKDALVETNKEYNLTAVTDDKGVAGLHFADSLTALKYLSFPKNLLDIGTGAGFPSLPIAIVRPEIKVTAIDSTAKKVAFSAKFAEENGLKNFRSLSARAEELILKDGREEYEAVTARAVARLNVLSELALPFVKKDGIFLALKGSAGAEEVKEAEKGIKILGGEVESVNETELILPDERQKRTLIVIRKVRKTPEIYPRAYAKIVKKPL